MRATIQNSMRQLGMKKIVVFVCGFLVTSMTIAACGDLTGPTSPETPINVKATLASPTSALVSWSPSPQSDGVVSYNIMRNGTKVGESTTTSFTDTGLAEKTTYKYTVSANCAFGLLSEASAETAATTVTTVDVTPPRIVIIAPVNGATNVSTFATVTATFNEAMDPTTINTTTFSLKVTSSGANIPGTVTYTAATRAEFTPTNPFPSSTSITATITAGAKDISGNALLLTAGSPGIWSFTTADQTPPTVIATSPANGASGVSATAPITVTFSEAMDATTINASNFTLRVTSTGAAVAGTVTYNAATHVATFTPNSALAAPFNYTATISANVKDVAGNFAGVDVPFSFTTGDTTPPTVVSTSPANLATNVPTNAVISATFSEAMGPTTITASTFTVKVTATSAAVAGTVALNLAGTVATFTPSAALASGTTYTATITTGAKDISGNALASNFIWAFISVDNVPPTVLSVSPDSGATSVAVTAPVNITFSEAMDAATITAAGNVTIKTTATLTNVTGTVTYNAATNVATFTPTGSLAFGTGYTLTVTTGVKDLAGNAMTSPFNSTFTTAAAPDTTPPTVLSTSPVNGTTVPIPSVVTVTFSEAMDSASVATGGAFTLKATLGASVTGTVTYNTVTHIATFTPSSSLSNNTGYTATITTGVKDLAGNFMAAPKVFAFTTIADTTPPTVLSTAPINGATAVPTTAVVTVTFSEAMDSASVATGGAFTLKLTVAGTLVTGTVTYNTVTHVATFTPAGPLAAATTNYTATVTTAAKDVAGNPLSPGTVIFAFTTVP
jgi:Bacterial Ig-like domain